MPSELGGGCGVQAAQAAVWLSCLPERHHRTPPSCRPRFLISKRGMVPHGSLSHCEGSMKEVT